MSDRSDGSFHSLEDLLDYPFERIETEITLSPIERLEALERKLQELDEELTEYLDRSSCPIS